MSDVSLENYFEKKGVVVAQPPADLSNVEDVSVDHAIEAGAEEVSPLDEDKRLVFTCPFTSLHEVKTKLQELKYSIEDSKAANIPKVRVELSENELELMSNVIQKLEQIPEVVCIEDNIM